MPELHDVANAFDDISVTEAYTGAYLFKAQFSTFNGASPDGSVSQRRVISVAPGITMPARGVITALEETCLVGFGTVDGIFDRAIRQSFWTKRVTDILKKVTPGEAALGSTGVTVLGHKTYLKDTVNTGTNADYDPFWEIYFSPSENVVKGDFFKVGTTYYRVRSSHLDISGFTNAASDELDSGARVSITFTETGAYNPVTDTFNAASTAIYGMFFDRYKLYERLTAADRANMAGDMTAVVAKSSITPVVGRTCTVESRTWTILNITAISDAWEIHLRRG